MPMTTKMMSMTLHGWKGSVHKECHVMKAKMKMQMKMKMQTNIVIVIMMMQEGADDGAAYDERIKMMLMSAVRLCNCCLLWHELQ